jgi:integrase
LGAAILFLYRNVLAADVGFVHGVARAKRPRRLPVVLTHTEIRAILGELRGAPKLCALLLYGSGLRLGECLALRVTEALRLSAWGVQCSAITSALGE